MITRWTAGPLEVRAASGSAGLNALLPAGLLLQAALREDFSSDTSDLLVEFQPMEPYARVEAYFGLLDDLRGMFGREIDLVMV